MAPDVIVAPDTNVIVASSIIENAGKLGIIKHKFYDQSVQLFGLFRDSDIGFAMPRVIVECLGDRGGSSVHICF